MSPAPLDENGLPIDWWFIYKVPELTQPKTSGYEYAYYDDKTGKLAASANTLDSDQGALHKTLDALFNSQSATTGWIIYNDETPTGFNIEDNGDLGHTKGLLAFDTAQQQGFWLLHSWPKYADPKAEQMPTPKYGQTFICLTLSLDSIRNIAKLMLTHQQPQVFAWKLADTMPQDDPLFQLTQPINLEEPSHADILNLTTLGGLSFKVIAKNRAWNDDFWNDLVGPDLSENFDVESWIRGAIPTSRDADHQHEVEDINYLDFTKIGLPWAWKESDDHAKWGLSLKDNWICVADINRMISQEKRGGGTIALQSPALWGDLDSAITQLKPDTK